MISWYFNSPSLLFFMLYKGKEKINKEKWDGVGKDWMEMGKWNGWNGCMNGWMEWIMDDGDDGIGMGGDWDWLTGMILFSTFETDPVRIIQVTATAWGIRWTEDLFSILFDLTDLTPDWDNIIRWGLHVHGEAKNVGMVRGWGEWVEWKLKSKQFSSRGLVAWLDSITHSDDDW